MSKPYVKKNLGSFHHQKPHRKKYYMPSDFVCIYEKTLTTTLDKNSRKKDTEKLFIHEKLYEKIKDNIIIKAQ